MIKIGLDLAVRTCGLAILENKKLVYNSFISKEKDYFKLQIEMADWVFDKIKNYINLANILIIEDIYVGLDPYSALDAARVQGAVIDRYYNLTKKFPIVISAMQARKNIGLETGLSKAEYQLWVIDTFKLPGLTDEIRGEIIRVGKYWEQIDNQIKKDKKNATKTIKDNLNFKLKELNKETKNTFNKLSNKVTKETGISSHVADAILLTQYIIENRSI